MKMAICHTRINAIGTWNRLGFVLMAEYDALLSFTGSVAKTNFAG